MAAAWRLLLAIVAAWAAREVAAMVCEPLQQANIPLNRQAGQSCGGTCEEDGRCAEGLDCLEPQLTLPLMGTAPAGVCIAKNASHKRPIIDNRPLPQVEYDETPSDSLSLLLQTNLPLVCGTAAMVASVIVGTAALVMGLLRAVAAEQPRATDLEELAPVSME